MKKYLRMSSAAVVIVALTVNKPSTTSKIPEVTEVKGNI